MKHRIHLATSALVVAALAGPAAAQRSARVRHLPPAEAAPGQALRLSATVDRGWEHDLEVRYRPQGATTWQGAAFDRQDQDTYVVTLPDSVMVPPGVEYFIFSEETAHFASAEAPHRVNVFLAPDKVRRTRQAARHEHRSAQIRLATEWVDYGNRRFGNTVIPDRYYRVDADVGYRVLSLPLESLRFGFTRLIGETPRASRDDDGSCGPTPTLENCMQQVGFKGGGWFELGFLPRDGVEIDARGMVMATQSGFNVGARGELRIGDSRGTYLGLGAELIGDVGRAGFVRLAWGTVPRLPMAATIEVTNFPSADRDVGVRLVYDVAFRYVSGFRLGGRVGYQARDQLVGGATLGLNSSLEF